MRKVLIVSFLFAACTDAGNTSIEIPFNLFASDELSTTATGACTTTPITSAGGVYKSSGVLELDPFLNPNAGYVLGLQVENYLSQQVIVDAEGNTLAGANLNDFHMEKAKITFIDIEGNLTGPPSDTALLSGVVRTGGSQNAAAIRFPAVTLNETIPWVSSFETSPNLGTGGGAEEDVVLEVQIFGELGSGEQVSSGLFHFPLQVCFGCENLPLRALDGGPNLGTLFVPDCTGQAGAGSAKFTPIAVGHGPCCSPQDFFVTCLPCGNPTEPCCGGPTGLCVSGACTGAAPTGVTICPAIPNDLTEAATCPTGM